MRTTTCLLGPVFGRSVLVAQPADDPGVPLNQYRQHASWGAQCCCDAYAFSTEVDLEAVIARLLRQRLGDAHTGI